MHVPAINMWRSEDNMQDSVLSYHAGPQDQTQVARLVYIQLLPPAELSLKPSKFFFPFLNPSNVLCKWLKDL